MAITLGLLMLSTSMRWSRSGGMAQAFAKTFDRELARLAILADAETLMPILTGQFESAGTTHPHSGLRMLPTRGGLSRSA